MTAAFGATTSRPSYPKASSDPYASRILSFALYIYLFLYATEGFSRWILNLVRLDSLIFIRDALVFGSVGLVAMLQITRRQLEPFTIIFFALLVLHGIIGASNLRDAVPVIAGSKPYLSLLIGTFVSNRMFAPTRRFYIFLALLWLTGMISAGIEKYFVDWPWTGLSVEIAGTVVDISKDWQLGSIDKRAAGLARSSIHLAAFMSVVGIILYYRTERRLARILIAAGTLLTLYWTTQKGALAAEVFVFTIAALPKRMMISGYKWLLPILLCLMVALPVVLPGYFMPTDASGVFSLQSFYDRAQRMWPDAWSWYSQRSTPLFGVGLGGIGFAMRLYSPEAAFYAADLTSYEPYLINFADNMFVYLFVQLGFMSVVYLGLMTFGAMRVPGTFTSERATAIATLCFCVGYGLAVSIIEDQISCMMLGASALWLWRDGRKPAVVAAPIGVSVPDSLFKPFRLHPRFLQKGSEGGNA